MRKRLLLILALGISAWTFTAPGAAQEAAGDSPYCSAGQDDCVPVGRWQVSVGLGLGLRTNPLVDGDDIPIVLLPSVSYYGERFFFDTTSLGYTLHEDARSSFSLVATVGLDSMYFNDLSLGNFVIEGTGGGFNLGGLALTDSIRGDSAEDLAMAPPVDETKTPNTRDSDQPYEFFHKQVLVTQPPDEPQLITVERIGDRKMAGLAGIEYSHIIGQTQVSLQALGDFTGVHDGQEVRFGLDHYWRFKRNRLGLAGGFVWQSARVVDYYYGLDRRDVGQVSQLYYQAGDALTPYLRADWFRPLTPAWTLQMSLHHKWLGSSIRHSPLVEEDSSTTVFVGGVYHFKQAVRMALALAVSGACWGQGEKAPADITLTVRPSLCILERGETYCRDEVEVSWQATDRYSVCLFEQGQTEPLDCWEKSRSGTYLSQLQTEDDVNFQLIEMADRQVLASRAFEVVADAQRYRRRRRNPWSFF